MDVGSAGSNQAKRGLSSGARVLLVLVILFFLGNMFMFVATGTPSWIPTMHSAARLRGDSITASISDGYDYWSPEIYLLHVTPSIELGPFCRVEGKTKSSVIVDGNAAKVLVSYEADWKRSSSSPDFDWSYIPGFKTGSYRLRIKNVQPKWKGYAISGELYVMVPFNSKMACIEPVK